MKTLGKESTQPKIDVLMKRDDTQGRIAEIAGTTQGVIVCQYPDHQRSSWEPAIITPAHAPALNSNDARQYSRVLARAIEVAEEWDSRIGQPIHPQHLQLV